MNKSLTYGKFALAVGSMMMASTLTFAQTTSEQNSETTTTTTKTEETGPARNAAGLFVEPMLLGSVSDTEIKTSQLPIITDDTSGRLETAGLGMRLGGHIGEVVFLAADARYNRSRFTDSFYNSADSAGYNYGATLGVQTPFAGVRVWGTQVLGGEMDPAAGNSGLDVKFQGARGYRVGAGLHFAALALSLEYEDLTYGNTNIQSLGSLTANQDVDVDFTQRGTILSLSFPVEL